MNISFSILSDPPIRQPVRIAQCSSGLPCRILTILNRRLKAIVSKRPTHLANMVEKHGSAGATNYL